MRSRCRHSRTSRCLVGRRGENSNGHNYIPQWQGNNYDRHTGNSMVRALTTGVAGDDDIQPGVAVDVTQRDVADGS